MKDMHVQSADVDIIYIPRGCHRCLDDFSSPQEGEAQSLSSRHLMELLARRNAIDITGAICHMATDLLHRAHSHPGSQILSV